MHKLLVGSYSLKAFSSLSVLELVSSLMDFRVLVIMASWMSIPDSDGFLYYFQLVLVGDDSDIPVGLELREEFNDVEIYLLLLQPGNKFSQGILVGRTQMIDWCLSGNF